jgi:transglutaminase-like putative cysteine protease
VLESRAQALPATGADLSEVPTNLAPWLVATLFVEAGDPAIRAAARSVAGDTTDTAELARRLTRWVDTTVRNEPRVSLPSAAAVLKQRVGDCNEHTYLFVALARSLGLPARIRVGIVYSENAFFYHAWPSVWVGEWVDVDPTFGQLGVDATHIALLEGEIENQVRLSGVLGRLATEVLSSKSAPGRAPWSREDPDEEP